jgi:hypothetical protein
MGEPRVFLNHGQAVEIYKRKIEFLNSYPRFFAMGSVMRGLTSPVAKEFGVTVKTIRDIWNRKTWRCSTNHMWHLDNDTCFDTHDGSLYSIEQSIWTDIPDTQQLMLVDEPVAATAPPTYQTPVVTNTWQIPFTNNQAFAVTEELCNCVICSFPASDPFFVDTLL